VLRTQTPSYNFSLNEPDEPPKLRGYRDYDNEWAFFLINRENPLPYDYAPNLFLVEDLYELDERCAEYGIRMIIDARRAGFDVHVVDGYRTIEQQQRKFNALVQDYMFEGFSYAEALQLTTLEIAVPGTSEHNAGLALDLFCRDFFREHGICDTFEETELFAWFYENSWRYGFILRYPRDTTHITGFIYEPWHFRFVGVMRAQEIFELGLTLEEYMELIETFKKSEDY
jgi:D-alanyl-D-alanine carboxypeptidase